MMNTIDTIINELASGKKLSAALFNVYSKRRISIPYSSKWFDISIRDLSLNSRITNALLRQHLQTLNDIVDFIERGNKITDVRNLGVNSCYELMEAILDYAWSCMSTTEQAEFLIDIVTRNERYLKA